MKVTPIDRSNREAVLEAAAKVDAILEKGWRVNGVKSQPALRDDQFLRRAYLELGGRIPTYLEATDFLRSRSNPVRRACRDSFSYDRDGRSRARDLPDANGV